LSANTILLVVG